MGRLGQLLPLQQQLLSSAVATSAMQIYQLRLMFGFARTAQLLLGRNILTLLFALSLLCLLSLSLSLFSHSLSHSLEQNHSFVHFPHHTRLKLVLLAEKS